MLERARFEIDGRDFWVTVSVGVADAAAVSGLDPHQLLVRADQALYAAKAGGRNRTRIWTDRLTREKVLAERSGSPQSDR
jgi:PleD family two-component response regulator